MQHARLLLPQRQHRYCKSRLKHDMQWRSCLASTSVGYCICSLCRGSRTGHPCASVVFSYQQVDSMANLVVTLLWAQQQLHALAVWVWSSVIDMALMHL